MRALKRADKLFSVNVCKFATTMEFFRIEDKNFVRTVTINNPRKKNALNKKAYFALGEILDAAGKDDKVKALVLTGNGDFFR